MYKIYSIFIVFLFAFHHCSAQTSASNLSGNLKTVAAKTDTAAGDMLVINTVKTDLEKVVHVSFQGDEGAIGKLQIVNSLQQIIYDIDIELIKLPYYTTINIVEFLPGTYSVLLTTEKKKHSSILNIE